MDQVKLTPKNEILMHSMDVADHNLRTAIIQFITGCVFCTIYMFFLTYNSWLILLLHCCVFLLIMICTIYLVRMNLDARKREQAKQTDITDSYLLLADDHFECMQVVNDRYEFYCIYYNDIAEIVEQKNFHKRGFYVRFVPDMTSYVNIDSQMYQHVELAEIDGRLYNRSKFVEFFEQVCKRAPKTARIEATAEHKSWKRSSALAVIIQNIWPWVIVILAMAAVFVINHVIL